MIASPVSRVTRYRRSSPFRNGAPSVHETLGPSGPRERTCTGSPASANSSTRAWRSSAGSQIRVSGAMQPLPARNRLMNWSPSGGSCSGRHSHHHSPRAISSRTHGGWDSTQASRSSFGSRAKRCASDKAMVPGYMTLGGGERDTSLRRFPELTGGGGRANLMERQPGIRGCAPLGDAQPLREPCKVLDGPRGSRRSATPNGSCGQRHTGSRRSRGASPRDRLGRVSWRSKTARRGGAVGSSAGS